MSRFSLAFVMLALGLLIALNVLSFGKQPSVRAAARPVLPAVTCDFTVLNFNLSGSGSVGASRPSPLPRAIHLSSSSPFLSRPPTTLWPILR